MKKFWNKNKALITIIVAIILIASVASGFIFSHYYINDYGVKPQVDASAQNVILLIGDGMGINHIKIAELFGSIAMHNMDNSSTITTRSLSLIPTDSAASATAFATGKKVPNGNLSYYKGKNLTNLGDLAKQNGKKLGIVTTKSVTDATPAAFSSHNSSRSNEKDIALEQIRYTQPDVLFGLGKEFFDPYASEINNASRGYYNSYNQLIMNEKAQAFAMFESVIPQKGDGSLASLTQVALSMLENKDGFFLMVEGAKIDSYSHQNNMDGMLDEFWGFNDAVQVALMYAAINTNTTVIVTADHETGKLNLPKELNKENINDKCFKSKRHTKRDVAFYISGKGADAVPNKLDNTDIFYIINQLLFQS